MSDKELSLAPDGRSAIPLGASFQTLISLLKDVAAVAVLVVFVVYLLGFVILNSHLAQFGIRVGPIFAIDLLTTGLCYVTFVGALAFPFWIVLHRLFVDVLGRAGGIEGFSKNIWLTMTAWRLLTHYYFRIGFSEPAPIQWNFLVLTAVATFGVLSIAGICIGVRRKRLGKSFDNLWVDVGIYGLIILSIIPEILRHEIDISFVLSSLLIYITIALAFGIPFWELRKELFNPIAVRFLLILISIVVVMANAAQFGRRQYGFLPQVLGGGRPSTIYIKCRVTSDRFVKQNNYPIQDGVIGPMLLLFRSSEEIWIVGENGSDGQRRALGIPIASIEFMLTEVSGATKEGSDKSALVPLGENIITKQKTVSGGETSSSAVESESNPHSVP